MAIHVGVVRLELYIPGARSLKDKRRAVKSLVDRMHHRYRVSVAETGFHELHQRAEVAVAVVAAAEAELEHLLGSLRRLSEESNEAMLTAWEEVR